MIYICLFLACLPTYHWTNKEMIRCQLQHRGIANSEIRFLEKPMKFAVAKWHYLLVGTDWLLGPQHQIPSLGIASFHDWFCLYALQSLHWICKNLNNARYFHVLFIVAKLHNNESLPQYGIRKVFLNKITYLQKHIDIGFWFHSLMTPCDRRHFLTLI